MPKSLSPLEKRLAAYAVSAGVVLAVAPAVDAQVIYTDIEPDVCLDFASHQIDLDGDSVNDFRITQSSIFAPLDSGGYSSFNYGDIKGLFSDNVFVASLHSPYAQALSSGATVSSAQNFDTVIVPPHFYNWALFWITDPGVASGGNWLGGVNAFVGLKFIAERAGAATTHYGWVRVSSSADGEIVCVDDFAYESTPDARIRAGALAAETSVTCTPVGPPIVIPAAGGSYAYDIEIINNGATAEDVDIWVDIDGPGVDRTRGPIMRTLAAGASLVHTVNQNIPGRAPAGDYTNTCNVGSFPTPDASSSFDFEKSAAFTPGGVSVGEWTTEAEFAAALAGEQPTEVPTEFGLDAAYPNPFNRSTTIRFDLQESAQVRLVVYDVLGRQVRVLLDGTREAGAHEVVFDASDLPSGTYLYRLETPQGSFLHTMLLAK